MGQSTAGEALIMWSLAWWWILFALPIPWLIRHFSKTEPTLKDAALKVPVPEEFAGLTGVSAKKTLPNIKLLVLILKLLLN